VTRLQYNHVDARLVGQINDTVNEDIQIDRVLTEGSTPIPSVVAPDILVLNIDKETIWVTAYTSGALVIADCLRGQEDTLEADHAAGAYVHNGPTKLDITADDSPTFTGEPIAPSWRASGKTGATTSPGILAGGTNTGAAPTTGAHVVGEVVVGHDGKLYVCTVAGTPGTWAQPSDAAVAGFDWKASARVAATVNVAVATGLENGDTVDGVTLATGDRVLLTGQTAPAENGLYVVVASGAASRATDADTSTKVTSGMVVPVIEGTANRKSIWLLATADPVTLGTTALVFVNLQDRTNHVGTQVAASISDFDAAAVAAGADTYRADSTPLHITARAMNGFNGSPALGAVGTVWQAWLLDAAATETVVFTTRFPTGWATYDIVLNWTNAGAGAGDVRWNYLTRTAANGVQLNSAAVEVNVTVTAPAQNDLKVTTLASGLAVPAAGSAHLIRLGRIGADAADTLANDCGLIDCLLVKAS